MSLSTSLTHSSLCVAGKRLPILAELTKNPLSTRTLFCENKRNSWTTQILREGAKIIKHFVTSRLRVQKYKLSWRVAMTIAPIICTPLPTQYTRKLKNDKC
jgi:hypothetical protein